MLYILQPAVGTAIAYQCLPSRLPALAVLVTVILRFAIYLPMLPCARTVWHLAQRPAYTDLLHVLDDYRARFVAYAADSQ